MHYTLPLPETRPMSGEYYGEDDDGRVDRLLSGGQRVSLDAPRPRDLSLNAEARIPGAIFRDGVRADLGRSTTFSLGPQCDSRSENRVVVVAPSPVRLMGWLRLASTTQSTAKNTHLCLVIGIIRAAAYVTPQQAL